jgi:hypothetical protein
MAHFCPQSEQGYPHLHLPHWLQGHRDHVKNVWQELYLLTFEDFIEVLIPLVPNLLAMFLENLRELLLIGGMFGLKSNPLCEYLVRMTIQQMQHTLFSWQHHLCFGSLQG